MHGKEFILLLSDTINKIKSSGQKLTFGAVLCSTVTQLYREQRVKKGLDRNSIVSEAEGYERAQP